MSLDTSKPYTHKSQYLVHVTLTGSNNSNLFANGEDNTLKGNSGANMLDGKGGRDTVVYCQDRSAYSVSREDGVMVVDGPEGRDILKDIEVLHFADGTVLANDL